MSSINTNIGAGMAMRTLTGTQSEMLATQARIASGYRIAEAQDNAAYWSIATTMRSDMGAMSAVKDALALGSATADVAYAGITGIIKLVDQMKQKLVAAREPGVDLTKIQNDITALQQQMQSTVKSATFSGQNWLMIDSTTGTDLDKSIVSSYSRDSTGAVSVGTITTKLYDAATGESIGLFDANPSPSASKGILDTMLVDAAGSQYQIAGFTIVNIPDDDMRGPRLDALIGSVDQALSKLSAAATTFGAMKARIDMQGAFVNKMMTATETGVSTLVDADMNEESTKLQALQTKQSLGLQSLSIANQTGQVILKLFQ